MRNQKRNQKEEEGGGKKVIFVLPVGWIYSCFALKATEYFINGSKEREKPRFDLK